MESKYCNWSNKIRTWSSAFRSSHWAEGSGSSKRVTLNQWSSNPSQRPLHQRSQFSLWQQSATWWDRQPRWMMGLVGLGWLPLMDLKVAVQHWPPLTQERLGKGVSREDVRTWYHTADTQFLSQYPHPAPPPLSFLHRAAEQTPQKVDASGDRLRKLIDATQTGAQPPCWELLGVCEGLWCITCVLVCCSAPAEGRTIRLWSAWCSSPGIFPGVRGSIRFVLQLLVSLSAALRTHWFDFGLFMASLWINKSQTINGPKPSLAALFLLPVWVVCVSLGIRLLLSGKLLTVSLFLNFSRGGVCNITNCHTA